MLYAKSTRLRLATGDEVQAFVRAGAYSAPSRSLVSRHGDQGFRAIAISRFAIAITYFGDGDRDRPGTQAW